MALPVALSRGSLRWVTIWGPACYLSILAIVVLYLHPHPLPPFWPALAVLLTLSAVGTFVFSRFVFAHVQRQELEIVRRTTELAAVNEAMAVVKERQRIARDLHDSIAQTLGYLHLRLADAARRTTSMPPAEMEAELDELKHVAREAYEESRQAIFGLRGMVSRSLGLVPSLAEYLHDWSRRTGVTVDLRVAGDESITLPPSVEVQLIGILQEALANVRKHARAQRVVVSIDRTATITRVAIEDDGVGFDAGPGGHERAGTFGLLTMRERAEAVGGTFRLTTTPGSGTRVELQVPNAGPPGRQSP